MIVDRSVNIPQLVREHLKKLIISRDIWKILHASVGDLLLKSGNTSILIVLKINCQMIPCLHCSGVGFHNNGLLFILVVDRGWRYFSGRWNNVSEHGCRKARPKFRIDLFPSQE